MADLSMKFLLFGEDKTATKALQNVGEESKKTGGHLQSVGKMAAIGMAAVATAAVAATVAIVAFGKESVDKFGEAAKETLKLQRYMGGTAEDASRFRSAFHMAGVSVDDAAKSLGIFSKFNSAASGQLDDYNSKVAAAAQNHKTFSGQLGTSASAFARLGIQIQTADGQTRPMKDLLLDFATQIKDMPNGIDKTTLVLKAFGRGGMTMLPFLNKGAEGVKALLEESDKLGTTLSGKDLDAVKANTIAKRQWGEALEGVQIQVGRYLYPILTQLTTFMVSTLIPGIENVVKFLTANLGPAFEYIVTGVEVFIEALHGGEVTSQGFLGKIGALGYYVTDTLIPGIKALADGFMRNVWPAMQKVGQMIASNLAPVVAQLAVYWNDHLWPAVQRSIPYFQKVALVIGVVVAALVVVIAWLLGKLIPALLTVMGVFADFVSKAGLFASRVVDKFGDIVQGAKDIWTGIVTYFNRIVSFIDGMPSRVSNAASGMWDGIKYAFRGAINWIIGKWNGLSFSMPSIDTHIPGIGVIGGWSMSTPNIPYLANGGIVTRPTLAMIGEAGPEAVVPLSKGGGFGGPQMITVQLVTPLGKVIHEQLLDLRRAKGTALGLG